jgi:hypothetical protein
MAVGSNKGEGAGVPPKSGGPGRGFQKNKSFLTNNVIKHLLKHLKCGVVLIIIIALYHYPKNKRGGGGGVPLFGHVWAPLFK